MEIIEINTANRPDKSGRGIVLMALGHHIYGRFAVNLAVGLKKMEPELKIALIHNESSIVELDEAQKFLFDIKIKCPYNYSMFGTDHCYVKPKLYLDKLSPFQETLFLDVDMVWSPYKKPSQVFEEYANINFTMANRGSSPISAGHSDWVDMALMKENFGIEKWIDLSSEWIYFKQSEQTSELFNTARQFYDDEKMICKQFAGGKPDEPAFCLAMLKLKMMPHAIPYYPTYWEPLHRQKNDQYILQNYYGISLGGKHIGQRIKKIADNLVKHYAYYRGVPTFENVSKSKYLKERSHI